MSKIDSSSVDIKSRLGQYVGAKILFFDGHCNLCNGSVNFLLKWDKSGKVYLSSLQSPFASNVLGGITLPDSLVYYDGLSLYGKSDGVIRMCHQLGGWFSAVSILRLFPVRLRDWVYDLVAKYRYRVFGYQQSCRMLDTKYLERFIM